MQLKLRSQICNLQKSHSFSTLKIGTCFHVEYSVCYMPGAPQSSRVGRVEGKHMFKNPQDLGRHHCMPQRDHAEFMFLLLCCTPSAWSCRGEQQNTMEGWTDGRTDGEMSGWMDRQMGQWEMGEGGGEGGGMSEWMNPQTHPAPRAARDSLPTSSLPQDLIHAYFHLFHPKIMLQSKRHFSDCLPPWSSSLIYWILLLQKTP